MACDQRDIAVPSEKATTCKCGKSLLSALLAIECDFECGCFARIADIQDCAIIKGNCSYHHNFWI